MDEPAYLNEALKELGVEYDHAEGHILWLRVKNPRLVTEGDRDRIETATLQFLEASAISGKYTGVAFAD
jgi:hypothetical protein